MSTPHSDPKPSLRITSALAWLGFGLTLLALLVAIEHTSWFHLKPATGTARALSLASDQSEAAVGASRGS